MYRNLVGVYGPIWRHHAQHASFVHGDCARGAAGVRFPLQQSGDAQEKRVRVALHARVHVRRAPH